MCLDTINDDREYDQHACISSKVQFSSAQDGIYVLEKAHYVLNSVQLKVS